MQVNTKLTFKVPIVSEVPGKLGTDEHGDVQKKITDEVFKRIKKYMPVASGSLANSKTSIEEPTKIKVDGPYARRQFFGMKKNGQPFDYNRSSNPLAGSHWDKRLIQNEGAQMVAEIQRYIDRKAGK